MAFICAVFIRGISNPPVVDLNSSIDDGSGVIVVLPIPTPWLYAGKYPIPINRIIKTAFFISFIFMLLSVLVVIYTQFYCVMGSYVYQNRRQVGNNRWLVEVLRNENLP